MTSLPHAARHLLGPVWNYIRAVMGDQAYERYLEVAKRTGYVERSVVAFAECHLFADGLRSERQRDNGQHHEDGGTAAASERNNHEKHDHAGD